MEVPFKGSRYFECEGATKGILLLHAYTGSPRDVNLLGRRLNQEGYSVLCPLFAGHDTSNVDDLLNIQPETWQEQTSEWVRWMQAKDFQGLYIFGLSMGGIFATWALAQSDFQLRAGGVFNAPVVTQQGIDIEGPFMTFASQIAVNQSEEIIRQGHRQQMRALERFKAGFRSNLSQIIRPFFIGQSQQDELIDPSCALLLEQALTQAQTERHFYPENTHVITVNRYRQAFEQDVITFIENN